MLTAEDVAVISNPGSVSPRPRLLDEVRRRLRVKHYSLRTEQAYVYWIRRYIQINGRRHPRELGGKEIEYFLSDLAQRHRVAPSTQNQALAALLFLYREVLALDLPWMENIIRAKRAPRLPVVLSRAETMALLRAMSGREALMAGLLYGSGLRLMECLRLRMKDVDLARHEITVRDGKGGKGRKTMLPERLRQALQAQIDCARAQHALDLEAGFGAASLPLRTSPQIPQRGEGTWLAICVPCCSPGNGSCRRTREAPPLGRRRAATGGTCRRAGGRHHQARQPAHP